MAFDSSRLSMSKVDFDDSSRSRILEHKYHEKIGVLKRYFEERLRQIAEVLLFY